jgi:hypothetical protein
VKATSAWLVLNANLHNGKMPLRLVSGVTRGFLRGVSHAEFGGSTGSIASSFG